MMKILCIGLVVVGVLVASSLAMPRTPLHARKQYAKFEHENQEKETVGQARAFGSFNACEYLLYNIQKINITVL